MSMTITCLGAVQLSRHRGCQPDGSGADDRNRVAGPYATGEDPYLVGGGQDVREHDHLLVADSVG